MTKFSSLPQLLIGVLATAAFSGCADDSLKKYPELGGLRVLALQVGADGADAEFNPGATGVVITPWISDYGGGTRTLSWEAKGCIDPGVGAGRQPSCDGIPGAVSFNGAVTVPATERTGAANTFTVDVPAQILLGRSPQSTYNGISYLVTYRIFADDGSASVSSFKRVIASDPTKTAKNKNPTFAGILGGGTPLMAWPAAEVEVGASLGASSTESYSEKLSDGSLTPRREEIVTTWFITNGKLKFYRTINAETTLFTPEGGRPTGSTPLLIGVARDERGGVSVRLQAL